MDSVLASVPDAGCRVLAGNCEALPNHLFHCVAHRFAVLHRMPHWMAHHLRRRAHHLRASPHHPRFSHSRKQKRHNRQHHVNHNQLLHFSLREFTCNALTRTAPPPQLPRRSPPTWQPSSRSSLRPSTPQSASAPGPPASPDPQRPPAASLFPPCTPRTLGCRLSPVAHPLQALVRRVADSDSPPSLPASLSELAALTPSTPIQVELSDPGSAPVKIYCLVIGVVPGKPHPGPPSASLTPQSAPLPGSAPLPAPSLALPPSSAGHAR